MPSTDLAGYGSTFAWDLAGGTSYTTVAGVIDITSPELAGDDLDVTTQDSSFGFREYIPGLVDAGEISVTGIWVAANVTTLYTTMRTVIGWQITFTDGSTLTGTGYIKAAGTEVPLEDKIGLSVSLKVSGKPTFTTS